MLHTEIARDNGMLTVEVLEDPGEYPGVVIRALTYGDTCVDVRLRLTHKDIKALMPVLAEAVERIETARGRGHLSEEGER